jgi:hypothetical protein
MRVIKTFFLSPPLAEVIGLVNPADVGPVMFSDVKELARRLPLKLDLPREPSPA